MELDLGACANAVWDHKDLCQAEFRAIRQRLERAGLGACVEGYLGRLGQLESRRPPIAGDHRRFDEVRAYREAVAQLSLAMAAAIALNTDVFEELNADCLEDMLRMVQCDSDVETLVRILLQCQIIDDVLDYTQDLAARLPSFLTACASLSEGMALTGRAARSYGATATRSSANAAFPLQMALCTVTALTTLVVRVAHWRHHPGDAAAISKELRLS